MNCLSPELKLKLLEKCSSQPDLESFLTLSQISASFYAVYCNNGPRLLRHLLESMCTSKADAFHAIVLAQLPTKCHTITKTDIQQSIAQSRNGDLKPSRMILIQAIARYRLIQDLGSLIAYKNDVPISAGIAATFLIVYRQFAPELWTSRVLHHGWRKARVYLLNRYRTGPHTKRDLYRALRKTSEDFTAIIERAKLKYRFDTCTDAYLGNGHGLTIRLGGLPWAFERDWKLSVRILISELDYKKESVREKEVAEWDCEGNDWHPSHSDYSLRALSTSGSRSRSEPSNHSRVQEWRGTSASGAFKWLRKLYARLRRSQGQQL